MCFRFVCFREVPRRASGGGRGVPKRDKYGFVELRGVPRRPWRYLGRSLGVAKQVSGAFRGFSWAIYKGADPKDPR